MTHTIPKILKTLTWFPVIYVFNDTVFSLIRIKGDSLSPTISCTNSLFPFNIALVQKFNCQKLTYNDIIVVKSPIEDQKLLVKRVLGLPFDVIYPRNGGAPVTVPRNHIWIEGDNVTTSEDSNKFGSVPLGLVFGKVKFVLYPFKNFGRLD